ncbi:MAG TPA: MMPL family transporter, partial [Pirellulaceae bacterium]|nr:MMPL family transporter [Pirellulaceae bacterium]
MTAEGTPHESSIFTKPLVWLTARILAAPRTTVLVGIAVALVAVMVAALGLGFRTSRLDLLNPSSEWNQRWLAYLQEFGQEDDAVLVVDGTDPAAVLAAVDDLAAELRRDRRHFSSVFHQLELGRIRAKGLHLAPAEKLADLEAFVSQAEPVLRGDWQQLAIANQLQRLTFVIARLPPEAPQRAALLTQLERVTSAMHKLVTNPGEYQSPWPNGGAMEQDYARLQDQHLLGDDGKLGFVLVKLIGEEAAVSTDHVASLTKARELLQVVESRHPQVSIGITGMPVLEHDEMQTSQRDMTWTSALSMFGVAACFWAAFGGWRHALLAMAALGISMCWAFGFVTMTVGHLNLLSVSFASVLIGQGVDFGIHYVAGYLRVRARGKGCLAALYETSHTVGPGIFTGGVTTAVAFCMTMLTDFTGLAELGLIAGSGIIICTIGALVLLPAMILWVDAKRPAQQMPVIVPMQFLTWPMHTVPRLTIVIFVAITIACGVGLTWLRYDHNLLHLQSRNLASVELEKTLLSRADRSVWFALSMSESRADLLARKAKFEALPTVSHTEEIVSMLPEEDASKERSVSNIRRVLALLPEHVPQLAAADGREVIEMLRFTQASVPAGSEIEQSASVTLAALTQFAPADAAQMLSRYEQQMAQELVERLRALQAFADPLPPRIDDVPRPLVDRFVGKSGQHLLKVYAAGDVWDIDKLKLFVTDAEGIDSQITGHPIQTYYASMQMQTSYLNAGIYAFIAMLIAVIVDLRRVRWSLLSVLPMFFGLVQTFGLLGWLGIPLNAANM